MSLPLVLGVGIAVDYSRHLSASKHLQEVADSVSLALAGSGERDPDKMIAFAQKIINSNAASSRIDAIDPVTSANFSISNDDIDVRLSGNIQTSFMGVVGYNVLGVTATSLATRAVNGSIEVALVLDNTWSMSELGKIASLKSAASTLVDTLMPTSNTNVKVSLVPYADYVNVGIENRNKPWVSVGADIPAVAATCDKEQVWVTNGCSKWEYQTCTRTVDGVEETYNCNGVCTVPRAPYWATQNVNCKGGVSGQKWFGCVGSRKIGQTRLNDGSPNVAYPGYLETSQKCVNPIVPLTTNKSALKSAISGMIINIGTSYRPNTYIPAGMIWGVNVLSPTAPFSEGDRYDTQNKTPRKAIVLMTDGENTLKYRPSDGRHVAFSTSGNSGTVDYRKVNAETNDICTYAKERNIEVFTVAFMVDNADAKTMLQACASDAEHYFDASDPATLMAAFSGIAQSLSVVRLAR